MECILYRKGHCTARQGEVLTQEIIDNPDLVHDRHFCKHKEGRICTCNRNIRGASTMSAPQ